MSEPEGVESSPSLGQAHAQGQTQTSDPDTPSQDRSESTDEAHDVEKSAGEESDGAFVPVKLPAAAESQQLPEQVRRTTSRSIERSWSLNDGYSPHTGYDTADGVMDDQGSGRGESQQPDYLVGWDERDPMDPRNLKTPRRWAIMLICSAGALCVYGLLVLVVRTLY